jgi:predicted lipoprotein with Yx(FWY)xxD motif
LLKTNVLAASVLTLTGSYPDRRPVQIAMLTELPPRRPEGEQMTIARAHHARRPLKRLLVLLVGATALAAGTPLVLSSGDASAARSAAVTTVVVEKNSTWGQILALSGGWTVYRYTKDKTGQSKCAGTCTKVWPPVLLAAGQSKPVGDGVGHLGSLKRADGKLQVTYEGIPLYRFVGDVKKGEVSGNGKDKFGSWWTVNPSHPLAVPVDHNGGVTTTTAPGGGISY